MVVSADGQPVQPVPVDEFRIGAAETYDVIVEPTQPHYQIQAESIDRSGFAIASLQNEMKPAQQTVTMPAARPRALLTMDDMGHGAHAQDETSKMDHSQHAEMDKSKVDHSQHTQMSKMTMNHNAHGEMDMRDMNHKSHTDMNMSQMHHHSDKQQSSMSVTNQHKPQAVQGWANASTPVGHKALQYTDLKALTPQPDTRAAERELVIRLGGTMERYIWTIDGKKFSDKDFEPLKVQYGERIRLKFVNESMMAHPMHLHGMFMQLENGQSAADMPNKHTVIVPPGKTVTALLTADELGEWAIHCHLLYHMSAGMMSKLIVANVNEAKTATQPISTPVQPSTGESHAHH